MKHNISITTIEALLINKALGMDMQNDVDNAMAELLKEKINKVVAYDLNDYRCANCKHFVAGKLRNRAKGQCTLKSGWSYKYIRYAKTKACKRQFEAKEQKND